MRLIDADALRERIRIQGVCSVYRNIEWAPTIDAEPVKRGKWIYIRMQEDGNSLYSCSECGHGDIQSPEVVVPYCWHCGAKMDAERKEE